MGYRSEPMPDSADVEHEDTSLTELHQSMLGDYEFMEAALPPDDRNNGDTHDCSWDATLSSHSIASLSTGGLPDVLPAVHDAFNPKYDTLGSHVEDDYPGEDFNSWGETQIDELACMHPHPPRVHSAK